MDAKLLELYSFSPSTEPVTRHDLTEVEHLMCNLAKKFENIFQLANVLVDHDFDKLAAETSDLSLRTSLQRPRVRLAKIICENYYAGFMPLITDIIYTKYPSAFIDCVPTLRAFDVIEKDRETLKKLWDASSPLIPSGSVKRGREDNHPLPLSWPPPLPPIRNEQLRRQVFTHRSATLNLISSEERRSLNNERLEFRGDMLLGFVIVKLVYERFTNAEEGELSKIKSRLVSNALLVEFSHAYSLTKEMYCSPNVRQAIEENPDSKFVADLFEAYICGLEMDQGYEVMAQWLSELYEPLIRAELDTPGKELDKNAKTELYRLIGSSEQKVEYVATHIAGKQFKVQCIVNGEVLGTGIGISKKAAGLQAAQMAVANVEAVRRLSEERRIAAEELKEQRRIELGSSELPEKSGESNPEPGVMVADVAAQEAPSDSSSDKEPLAKRSRVATGDSSEYDLHVDWLGPGTTHTHTQ